MTAFARRFIQEATRSLSDCPSAVDCLFVVCLVRNVQRDQLPLRQLDDPSTPKTAWLRPRNTAPQILQKSIDAYPSLLRRWTQGVPCSAKSRRLRSGKLEVAMNVRERYQSAIRNYEEFDRNPHDYRLLENALLSMDTVPERLALHQLGHPQLTRKALNEEAQKIRRQHSSLKDLHSCANTIKPSRSIRDHRGGKFTTTATSTGIDPNNQATWYVDGKYLPTVVHDAAATLKAHPQLNKPST